MPVLKIGCSGYPVGQKRYQELLNSVELSQMFDDLPRTKTIERWKNEAKSGFEFIACAPKDITHPKKGPNPRNHHFGLFQDTPEVYRAYRLASAQAQDLHAKTMFFQLAKSSGPMSDHVDRMHRFFKKINRGTLHFAWEAPPSWPDSLVQSVSKALSIIPVLNPLGEKAAYPGPIRYFRLGHKGKTSGAYRHSDEDLSKLKKMCAKSHTYVVFNNGPYAFEDAVRFSSLI